MILFPVAAAAALSASWPTYRLDLNNSSAVPGPKTASAVQLHSAWRFEADDRITSTPTYADGMIYFGTFAGSVYALDPRRGRELWRRNLGANPASTKLYGGTRGVIGSVAVVNGVAYADSGSCVAAAFDARTGRVRWKKQICNTKLADDTYASPVVTSGLMLVGIAMLGDSPTDRGHEIALDAANGAVRWTLYPLHYHGTGSGITTTPAIDETAGLGFLGTGNPTPMDNPPPGPDPGSDSMVAFDLRTGAVKWMFGPVNPHDASDLDFFASPNRFQINIGGTPRWVIGEANKNGTYYTLDELTGREVWHTNIEPVAQWPLPLGTPAVGGGAIYVPIYTNDKKGMLAALSAGDGHVIWRKDTPGMWEAPVLWGSVLLVTEAPGWLDALAAADGKPLGRWQLGGWLTGRGPSVVGNRLYLATSQYLDAFDLQSTP